MTLNGVMVPYGRSSSKTLGFGAHGVQLAKASSLFLPHADITEFWPSVVRGGLVLLLGQMKQVQLYFRRKIVQSNSI